MAFIDHLLTLNNFIYLILFIGFEAIVFYIYENLSSPIAIFINRKGFSLIKRYGKWAVVTGSTDGIGKEYAKELARKGLNIVLIARNKEKLINVSEEIASECGVETKWIVADFSKKKIYKHIEEQLEGIEVGILVNNVGQMYAYPEEFANMEEEAIWDMMIVNIGACTMMTRMLVNDMKMKKRGAIVNVSSSMNLTYTPYSAIYAASKIYVKYFSKALEFELEKYNITVQLLSPGVIPTKLCSNSKYISENGFLTVDVKKYAKSAVFTLGRTSDTTGGCWKHAVQMAMGNLWPMELNAWFVAKLMNIWYKRKF